MKHLGDVTKINGAEIEPVWCITAGSPCQDLSVAGKRAGLDGERSGLFMEFVRIAKEMREHDRELHGDWADDDLRPRFLIWENVPGAFSSNKGEDFRAVLEELIHIKEGDAAVPRPEKGKWSHSGLIIGDSWSCAWRLFDAQYLGVPQRRKRIALVMDLGGSRAGEILFEQEGLSGDSEQSILPWKGIARSPEECLGRDDRENFTLKVRGGGGERLRRQAGREGCSDSDGTECDSRCEPRPDTFQIDRKVE